jgi:dolichyl-phosphate-mannose-protein mannosyltransferase
MRPYPLTWLTRLISNPRAGLIAVAVIGLLTHAAFFGHPNSAVFDEVHFGKFISAYYTGEYYFDIHPPLGKLIIAGFVKPFGFQPGFSFTNIGDHYPDRMYLLLRLLPTLAGAALAPLLFLLARELGLSPPAAFLAGTLTALDNALLVQSRLILLDAFLLLFGFGAILCYARWRNGGSKWLLLSAGALAGGAASIKWTALTFLAIIGAMELAHLWKDRHGTSRQRLVSVAIALVLAPLIIYISSFVMHFSLLPRAGSGDGFMSTAFQKRLTDGPYTDTDIEPRGLGASIIELNREMYRSNQRLTANHPYSSAWYTWPVMKRPIFYWVQGNARIYLLGDPVIWHLSTIAVGGALWLLIRRRGNHLLPVLLGGYALNFIPFAAIGRVMFLYHYFTALLFAILILAWWTDRRAHTVPFVLGITGLAVVGFLLFAPLSYGLDLSPAFLDRLLLFPSWH